jgi:diguanylate cyclase (GGDEF)-like protein
MTFLRGVVQIHRARKVSMAQARPRWFAPVLWSSLLYCAVYALMEVMRPGRSALFTAVFNFYGVVPMLFGGACGLLYAVKEKATGRTARWGWLSVGLASAAYAVGELIYTVYESILRVEVPVPCWSDVGYLAVYPLLLVAVILLSGRLPFASRVRLMLDGAAAASAFGVISWHFIVGPTWSQSDLSLTGKLISVAYPLGDIATLFGAVVLLFACASDRRLRRSVILLVAGIVFWALGDSLYTFDTLQDTYHTGSWYDWTWPFGGMLLGWACLLPLAFPPAEETEQPNRTLQFGAGGLLRSLIPYGAMICAFAFIAANDVQRQGRITQGTYLAGMGLIFLVMVRQVFTLLENQHLTRQLITLKQNLEDLVARRTEQISALHLLAKEVNSTLDVGDVVAATLHHTRQALNAETVLLWLGETVDDRVPSDLYAHQGEALGAYALEALTHFQVPDRAEMIPLPTDREAQEPTAFCLRAPLRWRQKSIGIIGVVRRQVGFGATEWELIESIGIETGTALENARRYNAALDAADHDPVTGLLNHRALHQRLEEEFARSQRSGSPLSVIMMDLSNFKLFNDTYGHPAGDQVLKMVAEALLREFRKYDIVARYGGDEFCAVLPETPLEGAMEVAERLRGRVAEEGYRRQGEERVVPVTISCGVATYPLDSRNRHELLTIADANLYVAKNSEHGVAGSTEMQRENRELRTEGSFTVLDAMITAVDNKDSYTRRHSEDVTEYALWIGEELGLSDETMRVIRLGGLLHDVGKIGVPDEILRKPGRLTPEEFEVMKRHPRMGALIVGAVPGMECILDAVRSHHERWDGNGYPDGFAGEEIPFLGRLMAVADAYSAMTTDRPYRKGLEWEVAMNEIRANIGTQFDPTMAQAFLRATEKRHAQRKAA